MYLELDISFSTSALRPQIATTFKATREAELNLLSPPYMSNQRNLRKPYSHTEVICYFILPVIQS